MNPYAITSILFLLAAGLASLNSALVSFQIAPWFSGLPWLRVHLITLGALTEALFGLLPALVAQRAGLPRPRLNWSTWLILTLGLLILLVGIPLVNYALIVSGGTLIFGSALHLARDLRRLRPAQERISSAGGQGRSFYLAGLVFLLLGIIVGSGLWFGWGQAMGIANPREVHIHTNLWGFMSLLFAGLIVDLFPQWTGRELGSPNRVRVIFWMMTLGALGAVMGPWLAITPLMAAGILVHQAATAWLVVSAARSMRGTDAARKPGIWQILSAYVWQLGIVLATPLVALLRPGASPAGMEQTGPQVIVYGWVLQFGVVLIPYFLRRVLAPGQTADPGGSWFSLVAIHLGSLLMVASLLVTSLSFPLLGAAYLLWFLSLLPVARQMWGIVNTWTS